MKSRQGNTRLKVARVGRGSLRCRGVLSPVVDVSPGTSAAGDFLWLQKIRPIGSVWSARFPALDGRRIARRLHTKPARSRVSSFAIRHVHLSPLRLNPSKPSWYQDRATSGGESVLFPAKSCGRLPSVDVEKAQAPSCLPGSPSTGGWRCRTVQIPTGGGLRSERGQVGDALPSFSSSLFQ